MEHLNILTSFIAGVVMFLAPCTLPLVPGFISFISHGERQFVVKRAGMFCLGFLLTFLVFGLFAGILGTALLPYKLLVQRIGAVFVIILGLYMLGVFHLPFFQSTSFGDSLRRVFSSKTSPFFFGVSIALGWSPCVGPVLAGIFFYAAFSWSVLKALWLFLFFALGFIVPFMFVAHLVKKGKNPDLRSSKWLNIFAGLVLLFVGALLLADDFNLLASWAYKALQFIDYEKINSLL